MPIRPILLSGHERGLTNILFNRENDLMFTCAKDTAVSVWYSRNGERLGTFEGHKGAVYGCDVTHDSKYLVTSSADSSIRFWEVNTGVQVGEVKLNGVGKSVAFAFGDEMCAVAVNRMAGKPAHINIYSIEYDDQGRIEIDPSPLRTLHMPDDCKTSNFTKIFWGRLNEYLYSTDEAGNLRKWDYGEEEELECLKLSNSSLTDVGVSKDRFMVLVSSKDKTARLVSLLDDNFEIKKVYKSDRPLNACSISPLMNHILLAGGQDENMVTLSGASEGHFEAQFWHIYHEDCFSQVEGHFGPVNCGTFSPDGKMFATGGEDGMVRLYHFDEAYLKGTY